MQSQFICPHQGVLLGDLNFKFPEGTHAIGRLDKPSEGMLLLTTNKKITKLLFQSEVPHKRTYLVQVKRRMSEEALQQLQNGVSIRISGDQYYTTPPNEVKLLNTSPDIFSSPRNLPDYVESSWIEISLKEGKFRQIRKMVAATGHRVLRLIRTSIEDLHLDGLAPGEIRELTEEEFFSRLKLRQ
jgi:23S rRNA pseudouridine2457 synthase